MENGWKLTSELTSKWITFKNTQSNFTLISLITFEVINETPPNYRAIAVVPAMAPAILHEKRLRINVWIDVQMNNFWNTQSNFALISIITFEVVDETSTNSARAVAVVPADGACKITWKNGWELTSELTFKWITFKNTQSNFTLSH